MVDRKDSTSRGPDRDHECTMNMRVEWNIA